jgi:hypothetical protein
MTQPIYTRTFASHLSIRGVGRGPDCGAKSTGFELVMGVVDDPREIFLRIVNRKSRFGLGLMKTV